MKFVKHPDVPTINVLLVGPPKRGKTNGAATAPGGVLYNNFDLRNATRRIHRRNPDGRILEPELPKYREGQRNLFAHMVEIATTVTDPSQSMVDSVVLDPVDELYRRLLEEFSTRAVRPSLPTYGEVTVQVERFCRMLCEAPRINAVIVCHEILQQNGEDLISIPYTGTKSGSADLGAKLESMVDIIAHAGIIETEDEDLLRDAGPAADPEHKRVYVAQLIPFKGRNGGDRFACLGDWRPLNIAEWVDTIAKYERGEPIRQFDGSANVGTELSWADSPTEETAPDEAVPAAKSSVAFDQESSEVNLDRLEERAQQDPPQTESKASSRPSGSRKTTAKAA